MTALPRWMEPLLEAGEMRELDRWAISEKKVGVDAPIAEHVEAVVDGRMTAPEMMESFIARETKAETD